jgi:hypothetical protein
VRILGDIKEVNEINWEMAGERENEESEYEEKSIKESMTENETTVNENCSEKYSTPRNRKEVNSNNNHFGEIKEKGSSITGKCGILVNETVMGQIDKQYHESK